MSILQIKWNKKYLIYKQADKEEQRQQMEKNKK